MKSHPVVKSSAQVRGKLGVCPICNGDDPAVNKQAIDAKRNVDQEDMGLDLALSTVAVSPRHRSFLSADGKFSGTMVSSQVRTWSASIAS